MRKKYRALMGCIGIDGHEVGLKVVSSAFRDAGIEVIYLGLCQTPETLSNTAVHEDVDFIGISSMCGAHNGIVETRRLLKEKGADDIAIIAGGIISDEDAEMLKDAADVKGIFRPDTPTSEIVNFIMENI